MRKNIYLIVGLIILAALSFLVFRGQKSLPISQEQINKGKSFTQIGDKVYEEKEDNQGKVTVTVIPLKIGRGENTVFEVSLETHTVELDKDLKNISMMVDDKGNKYKPTGWTGGQGGHHIKGNLVFPPVSKDAKSIKLTIKEIDNLDRDFEWSVL